MSKQTIRSERVRGLTTGSGVPIPDAPTITSPSGIDVALLPLITTSAFTIANDDDHIGSQYQIATDVGFTTVVYDTDETTDLLSHQLLTPDYLDEATVHYVRARHMAKIGGWSDWSGTVTITTVDIYVATPVIAVTGSPSSVTETPTLSGGTFTVINGTDTHLNTDWQIFAADGITLVWQSLADSTNKTSITVPATYLLANTSYVFKVRYRGTVHGESSFSSLTCSTLAAFSFSHVLAVGTAQSPYVFNYERSVDTYTKLADPLTALTDNTYGAAFSPDGTYLGIISNNAPFINIYKRTGNSFTKLPNPSVVPIGTSYINGIAFSSDGVYMAVGSQDDPYILIYKRSGDTFTKLANPASLPPSVRGVAFSADGVYLACCSPGGNFIKVYKRSGDVFTALASPTVYPDNIADGVAFSADGVYMAVAHWSAPYLKIYKRSGDTFTKLADPVTSPGYNGKGVAFSLDGTYLAVGTSSMPCIVVYKRSGDTFTKLADSNITPDPTTLPEGGARCNPAFTRDGLHLIVGHDSTPYVSVYKRSGDTFSKLANPATLPGGSGVAIALYPSSTHGA